MKLNETGAQPETLTVLSSSESETTEKRREMRCPTELPLQLTSGSGELIPAVIRNLSANGLFATADIRFSLLLPPPTGARFDGEFFLDEVEARQLLLEVVRVAKRDQHLIGLGLRFVQPLPTLTTSIREKVASRLALTRRS
ncbi:MAG: PilZ domain-containing protein [Deltaproteobacteria bacterium]|nr:PilZ domain-containing protein [Deltaproteobacteria bacterium]